MKQIARPFQLLAAWLGGWSRLILLVVVIIGVGIGFAWERQRQVPVPPEAVQVTSSISADIRQTTFRYAEPQPTCAPFIAAHCRHKVGSIVEPRRRRAVPI